MSTSNERSVDTSAARAANPVMFATARLMPALALNEVVNLAPRWSHCNAYWTALIGAAARPDPAALRRVQLSGLQLAAAAQLPSEPREV